MAKAEANAEAEGEQVESTSGDDIEFPPDSPSLAEDILLPKVTYEEARKLMTRTDFLEPLDHAHVS